MVLQSQKRCRKVSSGAGSSLFVVQNVQALSMFSAMWDRRVFVGNLFVINFRMKSFIFIGYRLFDQLLDRVSRSSVVSELTSIPVKIKKVSIKAGLLGG